MYKGHRMSKQSKKKGVIMSIPGKGTLADNASIELFNYDNTHVLAKLNPS